LPQLYRFIDLGDLLAVTSVTKFRETARDNGEKTRNLEIPLARVISFSSTPPPLSLSLPNDRFPIDAKRIVATQRTRGTLYQSRARLFIKKESRDQLARYGKPTRVNLTGRLRRWIADEEFPGKLFRGDPNLPVHANPTSVNPFAPKYRARARAITRGARTAN
jgi:transglutaminase-like putative cysteine protease